jgi:CRP/FNR family transcriptional regulator
LGPAVGPAAFQQVGVMSEFLASTASRAAVSATQPSAIAAVQALDLEALRVHLPVVRRKLAAGQTLFRAGQPFHALYFVHAGFFKTFDLTADGCEQVTGFRMRGEWLGLDSLGLSTYASHAQALDSGEVWELPYPAVLAVRLQVPALHACMSEGLAAEMRQDRSRMLAVGTLCAERRVASFLLDVAARHAALGFSARHFLLRMSRSDIASYLLLKHETVSRALACLRDLECIAVQRRDVRILDAEALRAFVARSAAVH